jgi:hypothetical protein
MDFQKLTLKSQEAVGGGAGAARARGGPRGGSGPPLLGPVGPGGAPPRRE